MSALEWILKHKVVAILRGVKPAHMQKVVQSLYDGGITVVEITLNSEDAIPQIANLSKEYGGRMLIGAGTVLDQEGAATAKEAGASFLISPGFDEGVVTYAKENGLVSIPGAYTPTEILRAHKAGADIVKIFPVSDASYLKNVAAPLDRIRMMPTGGINTTNIYDFRKAGAAAFGIGSALVSKADIITDAYLHDITEKARRFTQAVASF